MEIYQPAYRCSDAACLRRGGWRFKALADAEKAKGCLRCGGPFAANLVLRALPQRDHGDPAGGGGTKGNGKKGKGKGKGKSAGGATAAAERPRTPGLLGGPVRAARANQEPVQPGPLQPPGGARHGAPRGGGSKPGSSQQPQARARTAEDILVSNVANAQELDGVDSDEYRKAVHRLQEHRRRAEAARSPEEVFNDLRRRVAQKQDLLATRLEEHTKAHQALETAQTRASEADEALNTVFTDLEELESKREEAEQRLQPPIMVGAQIKTKSPVDDLITQVESHLAEQGPKDQQYAQRHRETIMELRAVAAAAHQHATQAQEARQERPSEAAEPTIESHAVIPETGAPWQISTGTKAHARLLERGSTTTQQRVLERLNQKNKGGKKKGTDKGVWQQDGGIHDIAAFPAPAQARQIFQEKDARNLDSASPAAPAPRAAGTPSSPAQAATGSIAPPAAADEDDGMDFGVAGHRRKREEHDEDLDSSADEADKRPPARKGRRGRIVLLAPHGPIDRLRGLVTTGTNQRPLRE